MTLDAEILIALRSCGNDYISRSDLAQRTGASRATIRTRIDELSALGFDIEDRPSEGFRLRNSPDVLLADDLFSRQGKAKIIGRDIRVFKETTSTNNVVEKLAMDGVKEGVVVFAESQLQGRGRLGRKWISPSRKGLWFSLLLRPELRPMEATRLTIMAATGLARAIHSETNLSPEIKWPNDILLAGRKVAGILTELHAELDRVKYVILGIGVDVNLNSGEFPAELRKFATSIKIESNENIDRPALAGAILRELDRDYARLISGQFEAIAEEWEAQCTTIGKHIVIETGRRKIQGLAERLDVDGALILRTQHGHLERIIGGDLRLEK